MRSRITAVFALVIFLSIAAWTQQTLFASPIHVGLLRGQSHRLQVLDRDGHAYNNVDWTAEPGGIVSISAERGFSAIQAVNVGKVTVRGIVNGQQVSTDVTVYPGERLPTGTTTWVLPQLKPGTRVIKQLQSLPVSETTPTFYVQEGDGQSSYLRAIDSDGIQQWVWLGNRPKQKMRLMCGDNFGGAVLEVLEDEQHSVLVLNQDGTERWRAETAPWWAYTYTHSNVLYIVEDQTDVAMVTAFDGDRGTRKLQIPLPTNLTTHIDYDYRPAGGRCQPGEQVTKSSRGGHGSMVSDADGVVHVAATSLVFTFDATGCTPERPIDRTKAGQKSETRLQLLSITLDGEARWQNLRTLTQSVQGWDKPTEWLSPWGSTIPDGHGGVLVPARGDIGNLREGKAQRVRTSIFRVNDGQVKEYDMPLLPVTDSHEWNMLLGENDIGFFGGYQSIAAYRVLDGRVLWTWASSEPVALNAALADGGVAVAVGPTGRKVIRLDKNGKFAETLVDMEQVEAAVPHAETAD